MILKNGSKGNEVKQLQKFLGIASDGDFGKGTETSVKNWQSKNNLVADGVVGPTTWNAMGLASTDSSEKIFKTKNGLVIHRHFLPPNEYFEGPTKKEFVFLHHTAGWDNPYSTIDSWAKDTRGSIATEFVLGGQTVRGTEHKYDGELVQAFPEGGYGWHLGDNGSMYMHKHSVAVEVCNFGYVKDGKTYAGTPVDKSQIVTLSKPFRGFKDWHRYSEKQIQTLKLWLLWVAERDNIDVREGLPKLIKEKGADAFEYNENAYYGKTKGVWSHTNTRKDKFDMFPQQEFLDMLTSL
jgi:hypothetical protein